MVEYVSFSLSVFIDLLSCEKHNGPFSKGTANIFEHVFHKGNKRADLVNQKLLKSLDKILYVMKFELLSKHFGQQTLLKTLSEVEYHQN